jgi:hypothetical protein
VAEIHLQATRKAKPVKLKPEPIRSESPRKEVADGLAAKHPWRVVVTRVRKQAPDQKTLTLRKTHSGDTFRYILSHHVFHAISPLNTILCENFALGAPGALLTLSLPLSCDRRLEPAPRPVIHRTMRHEGLFGGLLGSSHPAAMLGFVLATTVLLVSGRGVEVWRGV